MVTAPDIIDHLAGIVPSSVLDEVRGLRPHARQNAQRSFQALLEPEDLGSFAQAHRYAVAAFVAGLVGSDRAFQFYADLLGDEAESSVVSAIQAELDRAPARGPLGEYPIEELAAENDPSDWYSVVGEHRALLGETLATGLEFAHLLVIHPRDAAARHLGALLDAEWDVNGIVSLAQLISFLNFQIREAEALAALGSEWEDPLIERGEHSERTTETAVPTVRIGLGTDPVEGRPLNPQVQENPSLRRPTGWRQGGFGWVPWIPPVPEQDLSPRQRRALVEKKRMKNAYFRLLARDPEALEARTLTDFDIFYNTDRGLSRAEREIAATATSRLNGCLFCASVHSARAVAEDTRIRTNVEALLSKGLGATPVATDQDPSGDRWRAVVEASRALTATPVAFGPAQVRDLRHAGLDLGEIVDIINGAAFFNWANRLMLSLGEPELIG